MFKIEPFKLGIVVVVVNVLIVSMFVLFYGMFYTKNDVYEYDLMLKNE